MAAAGEEMTTTVKEGANLLGKPKYKKIENGRFRCVQTGHELLEKDKKVYSESKRCRLGLIDHALSHNKPPLNLFEQDPSSSSKLKCKLTGDTVNKTEEHIWKHINGRRFLNKLEEKEREKESGAIPEEGGETVVKENGVKEEKKKNKKKKKKNKKNKKKNKKEENGEDVVMDELQHENDEDVGGQEELDFWMPPDGERWDFDDGGDRWGSDSEEEEEKNGEEDPIVDEMDEDGNSSLDDCIIGEVDEDGENSLDETLESSKKRKPEELSSKKNKKKKINTTAS
ncbi:PREDICTED: retrotransposon-like protein 1 isoform X1 [Brassica oleracea var. oleracea]|uniref:retrotransposon-like protein 1 isoform X1 n=1 Tax=Brassica oleracea var. oleracea TaxID=109376 RepID=UPI0006A6BD3A|nr:PREDICTED: retrotransposon-like protein 1 isoform X1 [Brassica oleracea var. oleracea]